MGSVYEARDEATGLRVAAKLLRPRANEDGLEVARFYREASITSRICHPNVVTTLDVGREDDGQVFLIQEYLAGSDLRSLLDIRGRLPVREALEVLAPVMNALVFIHRAGVVHRDLKPENIFLSRTPDGALVPKLIDFGISKATLSEGTRELRLTRTGAAVGTPYYMSPEQCRAQRDLDDRSDVWSLGVVLYEALSGRYPFDAEVLSLLMVQILTEPIPRLDAVAPDVPRALADVVHSALTRNREQRPDMERFLEAVLDCDALRTAPWHASLTTTQRRLLASRHTLDPSLATTLFEVPATSPGVPPRARRAALRLAGPVGVGVALLAALGLALRPSPAPSGPARPRATLPVVTRAEVPPGPAPSPPAVAPPVRAEVTPRPPAPSLTAPAQAPSATPPTAVTEPAPRATTRAAGRVSRPPRSRAALTATPLPTRAPTTSQGTSAPANPTPPRTSPGVSVRPLGPDF